MKFNTERLKNRIKFQSKVAQVAALLGISQSSLYFKLRGRSEFKQSEIVQIAKILKIPKEEIYEYFLDTEEW